MGVLVYIACLAVVWLNQADAEKCLQCVDMPHPFDCNLVTECSSSELCFVEQFITSSGLVLYNSGCRSKQRCSNVKRDIGTVVKRQDELLSKQDLVTCIECCQDEFCNTGGCNDLAPPRANRGPKCFDCKNQLAPGKCRDTVTCDSGEICAILRNPINPLEWTSKCSHLVQCEVLVQMQLNQPIQMHSSFIGKRDIVKTCPRCCSEDFCNDDCIHNETITTTTKLPPTTTNLPLTTTKLPLTTTKLPLTTPKSQQTTKTAPASVTNIQLTTTKPRSNTTVSHVKTTSHSGHNNNHNTSLTNSHGHHNNNHNTTHSHTKQTTTKAPVVHNKSTAKTTAKQTHPPKTTTQKSTAKTTAKQTQPPTTVKTTTAHLLTTPNPSSKYVDNKTTVKTTAKHTNPPKTTAHVANPKSTAKTTAKQTQPPPTKPTTTPHLITTPNPSIMCKSQGYIYDAPTRLCLKFYTTNKLNWTDAQDECQKHHGRLVVVTSDLKKKDVNHYLSSKSEYHGIKFWVGATEITHVHTFTWSDGKTIVVDDYKNYDLTKTNCLLTANPVPTVVYDPCPERNAFICENSNYIRP